PLQPGSRPGQITSGPDGALWFTETVGNKIGRITTAGAISEFDVPTSSGEPFGITAGPDGALWFAERNVSKIGRITTAGEVTEYDTPTPSSNPEYIAAGPDGALWFTESLAGQVGRITTAGDPAGIAAGPDGALWFTEQTLSRIGRITTAGVVTEYATTTPDISPVEIAAGPDGALWFTTGGVGIIGRITTAGLVTNEFLVQPDRDFLYGIAAGPDGAMWFSEPAAARVARVTTGLPGASSSITGSAGNASAVVSWLPPTDGGANGLSRYTVSASPGGRTCSTVVTSGVPTCTVTGLTNGKAYTFSVQAVNGFGTGPASSASTAVTPRTVPGAPRSLGLVCPSATRAKISWSAPSSNGGASITKYQVRFKDKVTGRYTAWANTTGRSFTKAGLIKNRSYMVQVRAVNVARPGSAASKTFKQLK
ncbi:MAG: fibronectin type III domain-containing protein, partial [Actinobacteria bacterium]|nr:fibronectin type III domain-containing protein [Actinomycetota bacterium]